MILKGLITRKREREKRHEQNGFREYVETLNSSAMKGERENSYAQYSPPPYFVSDTGIELYTFEHQILRDLFYSNTIQFTDAIKKRDDFQDLSRMIAEYSNTTLPLRANYGFHVSATRLSSFLNIITIIFHKPKFTPLCYRIYMLYSDEYTNLGYYTIESGSSNDTFLCGWDTNGVHSNFGEITIPEKPRSAYRETNELVMSIVDLYAKKYGLTFEVESSRTENETGKHFLQTEKLLTKRIVECSNWYYKGEKFNFYSSPLPSYPCAIFHPSSPDISTETERTQMEMRAWTNLAIKCIADRLKILDTIIYDDLNTGGLSIKIPPKYKNGAPDCWINIMYDRSTTALTIERSKIVQIPASCVQSSRMAISEYSTVSDILHVSNDGEVYASFKTYYTAEKALDQLPEMIEIFQDVVDRIYPDLLCSSCLQSPILKTHPCSCSPEKQLITESLIYGPLRDGPSAWYYKSVCRCKSCHGYLLIDIEDGQDGDPCPIEARIREIDGLADAEKKEMFFYSFMWMDGDEFGYLTYSP